MYTCPKNVETFAISCLTNEKFSLSNIFLSQFRLWIINVSNCSQNWKLLKNFLASNRQIKIAKQNLCWPASRKSLLWFYDVISSHFVIILSFAKFVRFMLQNTHECEGVFVNSRVRSRSFRPFCCFFIGRGLYFFFFHNSRSHFTIILLLFI